MIGDDGSTSVERYELLGELAIGGMATVYVGRQKGAFGFARTVAIKSMHPQLARDPAFRAMFIDEANLTARIRHPNVVPTLDIVSSSQKLLLVMEYVEGVALSTLLAEARRRGMKVPVPVVASICRDLLEGLHAAHELKDDRGQPLSVVHRDVSPQNILVGVDGSARVVDFGVAKAAGRSYQTQTGEVRGKVGYMAPEQMFGEAVDRRVDIYASGVVMWEALAGERLFDAPTDAALVLLVTQGVRRPPSVSRGERLPQGLDQLVERALAQEPERRWSSAAEMSAQLSAIAPLASRDEVGRLVRELGQSTLARGASYASATNPVVDVDRLEPEARAVLDVLTRATMTRDNSVKSLAAPRRGRAVVPLALGVILLALLVAVTTRTLVLRPAPASAASSQAAVSLPPPLPSAAPPPPTEPPPPPSPPPSPAVEPTTPSAKKPKAPVRPSKPPAPSPAASKPDCTLPYTTDEEGHRHYRAECLK